VAIKGLLSFSARWTLIGVSRDIEFDIRKRSPEAFADSRTRILRSQSHRRVDVRATNDLNAVRMVLGPGIMYSATTIIL